MVKVIEYDEVLELITKGKKFEGMLSDSSLFIQVNQYVPYICLALHHGNNIRKNLAKKINLSSEERYHEEEPFTGELISSLPIIIISQDSRYEYDLNLNPEECIYDTAWDVKVWKKKLSEKEKEKSLQKHERIHNIISQVVYKIIEKCSACLVFDIHAYNVTDREYHNPPTFNVGTHFINKGSYKQIAKVWMHQLEKVVIPNVDVSVQENKIFNGSGYLAETLNSKFDNCLVLPTDIKKVFASEFKNEPYPLVIEGLKAGLKNAMIATALEFADKSTRIKIVNKKKLLPTYTEKTVLQVDNQIFKFSKGLNTIALVNPINLNTEKSHFFSSKNKYIPDFKYRQLHVNPYKFKESLYRLPIDDIVDISLQKIYRAVVDYLAVKIELIASIGTSDFIYNSLRFYGEPSENDIKNAKFILHLQHELSDLDDELMSLENVVEAFESTAIFYGIDCKVEISNKIVAKALVNNARKSILLNKNLNITRQEMTALISHELGVHMVTTFNAIDQPLKVLRTGLPFNTLTQEGLAILSEYLCGHLSIKRLKHLALRVMAISLMLKGNNFYKVFIELTEEYSATPEDAFGITTRVFRGGGFTKDYMYLRGFKLALKAYESKQNLLNLLVGKTSFEFYDEISELIERGILNKPKYQTQAFVHPAQESEVIKFLVNAIR